MATLAVTFGLLGAIAPRANAAAALADVLILGPTVTSPATSSIEYTTVTSTGRTVYVATTTADWATQLAANPRYKAIILGDPNCGSPASRAPIAWAETPANATALAAAVTGGNVVIIGTDPGAHRSQGGAQLWTSAINFALASPPGVTGAVISLSCYYDYGGATSPTQVHVLDGFGSFLTQQTNCSSATLTNNVAIVAVHPALAGLLESNLSGWSCSVHEGFTSTSWPIAGFIPLAIATDPGVPHTFNGGSISGGAVSGFPYILARGEDLKPVEGILKVCKVAGLGVAVGTPFTFTAGTSTFTVPAGPAPGGTCVVGPSFPVGSIVTVDEVVPAGHVVSAIAVAPTSQLVTGSINLAAGSVDVTIGSGVTEVTFTDKRTGFVEICKRGHVTGNFTFTVNPGSLGPFVVPAGACSPAIEVAAGSVTIRETTPVAVIVGCNNIPIVANQLFCNTPAQTSIVNVVPGNVSTLTIAFITNTQHPVPTGAAPIDGHTHALGSTGMTLACTPNPAPLREAVTCTAKVTAIEPKTAAPTGAVRFVESDTTLATVPLSSDGGTAAFTTSTLAAGPHAILATYSGDASFGPSGSQTSVTVAPP